MLRGEGAKGEWRFYEGRRSSTIYSGVKQSSGAGEVALCRSTDFLTRLAEGRREYPWQAARDSLAPASADENEEYEVPIPAGLRSSYFDQLPDRREVSAGRMTLKIDSATRRVKHIRGVRRSDDAARNKPIVRSTAARSRASQAFQARATA